jgi:hypothetical protein
MFLFGNGEKPILALDNVTNNSALTNFVAASVYPQILLESMANGNKSVVIRIV